LNEYGEQGNKKNLTAAGFCDVTLFNLVAMYRCFGDLCCLHIHGTNKQCGHISNKPSRVTYQRSVYFI